MISINILNYCIKASISKDYLFVSVLELLFNLDKANIGVFRHGKVTVDETHKDHTRVEKKCSVEPKPVYELREEF